MEDSDSSSDESYFARMAALPNGADNDVRREDDVADTLNEEGCGEDYFERLQRVGETQSEVIQEESTSVWRLLKEEAEYGGIYSLQEIAHEHKGTSSEYILSFLQSGVPHSAKVLHTYKCSMHLTPAWRPFVDNRRAPRVVLMVKEHKLGHFDVCLYASSDDLTSAALFIDAACRTLADLGKEDIPLNFTFGGLDAKFLLMLEDGLRAEGIRKTWEEAAPLYALEAQKLLPDLPNLPKGFSLGPIGVQRAEFVNDNWPFKSDTSLEYIRSCLENYPSAGISWGEELCGWILTYPYGAIGFLHVCEKYRRRGFAKILSIKVIQDWMTFEPSWGCPPYCYIVEGNEPSIMLYRQLNFDKISDVYWAGFARGKANLNV